LEVDLEDQLQVGSGGVHGQWVTLEEVAVGVLLSDSPRGIPRRVVVGRDSPGSECDGARNTKI
jgi:hypothetical protein